MIKRIEKDKIRIKTTNPINLPISNILANKIKNNWNEFIKNHNNYFDGEIFIVGSIKEENEIMNLEVSKGKYSYLIYAIDHKELKVLTLFSSILFKTKDNYYLFIKNNHDRLNIIGGLASPEDFDNNIYNPTKCLKREVLEELGLDLDDKSIVSNYKMSFISLPGTEDNIYPTGIVFMGELTLDREELIDYFNNNKFDDEIKELVFYQEKDYQLIESIDNKEQYLPDLLIELNKKD